MFIFGTDVAWVPSKTIEGMGLLALCPIVAVEVRLMAGADSCGKNIDGAWFPAGLWKSEKVLEGC